MYRLSFRFVVALLLVFDVFAYGTASANDGDRFWEMRAKTMEGDVASSVEIERAIASFRRLHEVDPSSLEARWKLLRALHFLVDFSNAGDGRKNLAAEEAIELAETSIETLDLQVDDSSDRAQLYFWSAIAWGARAQRVGLLTIAREGAATRMQEYAETSRTLDPTVEQGGAMRLLSRLHASLPRVPFLTGWVDRSKTLEYAEAALALGPEHLGNQLVLALAILEQAPERRTQAEKILQEIANAELTPAYLAEETAIRKQAREQLSALQEQRN